MGNNQIDIPVGKYITWAIIAVIGITVLGGAWYTIPAGHRGIILTFGKPTLDSMEEGLNFKMPLIQKIVKMDIRTQKYEAEASSASKDLQVVSTTIAVNYHLEGDQVPRLYTEVGKDYGNRLIVPAVQEVVKGSTAKFTAEELITRRADVKENIKQLLIERLQVRGIIVEDISITDFDFSDTFNKAIEDKVTAEQLKLKAERDLERVRLEAEQKLAQARAEAEGLKLQKEQITPDLVRLRQIEVQREAISRWNGQLPTIMGGAMPFINFDMPLNAGGPTNSTGGN